jgi:N-acetylglutamate synthase-like GNAT family acetyltransferase
MSDIWVRKAEKRDVPLLAQWMSNTPNNLVDPAVFAYPNTQVYVAHKDKPVAFLPVQLTMTLESLAYPPDATDTQKAAAIAQLFKTAVFIAREKQIAEIYFYTSDPTIATFALRHGFHELPHRSLRLKIGDLETVEQSVSGREERS